MASIRGFLSFLSWIFLAGGIVMMFFVILSGVTDDTPVNMVYFLRANTSGIEGARPISQWTYFYVCGDGNMDCGPAVAALPFGYAWNRNSSGVPSELFGDLGAQTTSAHYFYMWRFGWTFYLMGLIFGIFGIFSGLVSCTRLGAAISGTLAGISCFWTLLGAILMTITFVQARDVFNLYGYDASVGAYAFGFTWAAVVCLIITTILFCGSYCAGSDRSNGVRDRSIFRRNHRPRGSFAVKDEY